GGGAAIASPTTCACIAATTFANPPSAARNAGPCLARSQRRPCYNKSMSPPVEKPRYSIDDYLRLERDSRERHEFIDGQILAMAGGSYNHSLIIANFSGELRNCLK